MTNILNTKARLSEKDMADLLKDHLGDTFYYLENLKKWVFFEVGKGWVEEREEELRSKHFYDFLNKLYNAPSSIPKEKVETRRIELLTSCLQSRRSTN